MLALGLLVGALQASDAVAQGSPVKITKSVDVGTRLFQLRKVKIDQPLGALRIRGWDRKLVRIRAVKRGPSAATVRRLKVHADINKGGSGLISIRTGVLMKVPQSSDPRRAARLMARVQKLRRALALLRQRPKPWSGRDRRQIRLLWKKLLATIASIQETVTSKLVARLRSVPIKGASLELTLLVPRGVAVEGRTSKGDIDVADLRGDVTLVARQGRIFARNVRGAVTTRTDTGHQYLSSIRGAVSVKATEGDLRLRSIRGAQVLARLVRGQIIGHDISTPLVRFTTTEGSVTITATLKPGGRIEVRTRKGDIDVRVLGRTGFRYRVETGRGRMLLPGGVRLSGPSAKRRSGKRGRGGGRVSLHTVYGTVSLR